jgi:hypothetical protein
MPPWEFKINDPQGQLPIAGDPNRHTIFGDPGTGQLYFIGSDPGVAFDSRGRAFLSIVLEGVTAEVGTGVFPSGLVVLASPPGAKGSFYFPSEPIANSFPFALGDERAYTVVEDNTVRVVHDKPLVAADSYTTSPNRDNVYATWTVFLFDSQGSFQRAPIYGSMSTDHGVTWSTPEQISGDSPQLCVGGNSFDQGLSPSACNFDQASDPQVLPNGDLAVAYQNFNTPSVDNQILAVHCRPTGSSPAGTAHFNCGSPAKIGDDVSLGHPRCRNRGQSYGCIPGTFVRAALDAPSLEASRANGHLYVVWQDYRNGEFDIQIASSTDGGLTWGPASTVNPDHGLDHSQPALAVANVGGRDRVGVSYYRTARVPNENPPGVPSPTFTQGQPGVQAEPSDYVLTGGTQTATPFPFDVLSPAFPPPDGVQTGFMGDYSQMTIPRGTDAHPIWADTRNIDPFRPANGATHDLDIFTTSHSLPNGVAPVGLGTIGQPLH